MWGHMILTRHLNNNKQRNHQTFTDKCYFKDCKVGQERLAYLNLYGSLISYNKDSSHALILHNIYSVYIYKSLKSENMWDVTTCSIMFFTNKKILSWKSFTAIASVFYPVDMTKYLNQYF